MIEHQTEIVALIFGAVFMASLLIKKVGKSAIKEPEVAEHPLISNLSIAAWKCQFICYACKHYNYMYSFSDWVKIAESHDDNHMHYCAPKTMVGMAAMQWAARRGW